MAKSIYYKTVLIPVEVCVGDFCAGGPDWRICTYFDNQGGHPTCDKKLGTLMYDEKGQCLKPDVCRTAKEVE